mmetsp:Transcript_59551/g.143527  ORF Transcript_59551/g.143527 Transcript_59551/m.143527 type:complete len:208 (+) Transcript_59551:1635-2258(+)
MPLESHVRILGVMPGPAWMTVIERGRGVRVASPPLFYGSFAVLLHSHFFVEPGKHAIVPLVQPPPAVRRDPRNAQILEDHMHRLDRTLQHRCEGNIKREADVAQQLCSSVSVLDPLVSKGHVHPSRETVLLVPQALAVPKHHESPSLFVVYIRCPAPQPQQILEEAVTCRIRIRAHKPFAPHKHNALLPLAPQRPPLQRFCQTWHPA